MVSRVFVEARRCTGLGWVWCLLFLSWRFICGRKRVMVVIVLVIAGVCAIYLYSDCFVEGLADSLVRHSVGLEIPFVEIRGSRDYIGFCDKIAGYVDELDGVTGYSIRFESRGFIEASGGYRVVSIPWC